jgi:hypothetical protein
MRIRKRYVVLLVILLGGGILVRYALRDIHLDVDLLREGLVRMSGVVLENLEFEREMSGDHWLVNVPLAQRREGRVELSSPDVRRVLADGKKWQLKSEKGVYYEKEESAGLSLLTGTLEVDTRVLNLKSPYLTWAREEHRFVFPLGVTVYDAEFLLSADQAQIEESGVVSLDRGGVIVWRRVAE